MTRRIPTLLLTVFAATLIGSAPVIAQDAKSKPAAPSAASPAAAPATTAPATDFNRFNRLLNPANQRNLP
ncbi:cytochrome c, class I, partial [Aromatoleum toluclasticum]|nr:cytochrome c, class I [Aromatoleum toluclasticum]